MANEVFTASLNIEANLDERQLQARGEQAAALIQKQFDKIKLDTSQIVSQSNLGKIGRETGKSFSEGFSNGLTASIRSAIKTATTEAGVETTFAKAGREAKTSFVDGFSNGLAASLKRDVKSASADVELTLAKVGKTSASTALANTKLSKSSTELAASQKKAEGATKGLNSSLEQSVTAGSKAQSSLGSVLRVGASLAAGAGIGAFITKGIQSVANVEGQNKALQALTGQLGVSADQSRKQIQQFADVSDFSFDQVFHNVIKLSNALKTNLPDSLSVLNDIASAGFKIGAGADQIDGFTNALIRTAAKGKISSRELIEFADTGIASIGDIEAQVAKDSGKTIAQVQKDLEKGAISSAVGIKAVDEVLKKNAGNVDIASGNFQTLNGAISAFFDKIQQATAAGLKPFSQILRDSGPIVDQIVIFIRDGLGPAVIALSKAFLDAVGGFKGTADLATAVRTTFEALAPLVKNLTEGFLKLLPSVSNFGAFLSNGVFPVLNTLVGLLNKLSGPLGFLLQLFLEFKTVAFIRDIFKGIADSFLGLVQRLTGLGPGAKKAGADFTELQLKVEGVTSATNLAEAAYVKLFETIKLGTVSAITSLEGLAAANLQVTETAGSAAVAEGGVGAGGGGGLGTVAKVGLGKKLLGKLGIGKKATTAAEGAAAEEAAAGAAAETGIVASDAAAGGLLASLGALSTALPVVGTVGLIAFTAVSNAAASANRHAQELLTTTEKGFDFKANLGDLDKAIAKEKELAKERDKQANANHFRNVADLVNPFGKNIGANAAADRDALNKQAKALQDAANSRNTILSSVAQTTGESAEAIFKRATAAGIDFTTITSDQLTSTADTLIKTYGAAGAAVASAFDQAKTAADTADAAVKTAETNLNNLVSASDALKAARQAQADVETKIKDKVKDINDVLGQQLSADQLVKLSTGQINDLLSTQLSRRKEIFDAQNNLRTVEKSLADIVTQRSDAQAAEAARQADFQPKLLEFADKIKLADIGRTEALLAQIDAQKALDALTPKFRIDFNPTSLADAGTQLANAKEVLKAQQFSKSLEEDKTATLKAQLNLQKAGIGINEAQRGFDQANKDQATFITDNVKAQGNFNKLIDDLAVTETGLNIDRAIAGANLTKTLTGQIGLTQDVVGKQKELTGLQKDAAVAQQATTKASLIMAKAVADASGDQGKINKANIDLFNFLGTTLIPAEGDQGLRGEFKKQLTVLQDQTKEREKQAALAAGTVISDADKAAAGQAANTIKNLSTLSNLQPSSVFGAADQRPTLTLDQANTLRPAIQELLRSAVGINGIPLGPQARDSQQNAEFINTIIRQILQTPGSNITEILRAVARQLGIRFQGFAAGGVIEGTPGAFGQLVRVAEYGRREAILPLESPLALQRMLSDPKVLNPILDSLPRISLPQPQGSPVIRDSAPSLTLGTVRSVQQNPGLQDANKERKLLAEEIGRSVAEALMKNSKDGQPVQVTINLDSSGHPELDTRIVARELERRFLSN